MALEGGGGQEKKGSAFVKHRGLIPEKECRPDKFDGEIGKFRRWRNEFMEFVDAQRPGLKRVLEDISKNKADNCDHVADKQTNP